MRAARTLHMHARMHKHNEEVLSNVRPNKYKYSLAQMLHLAVTNEQCI